MNPNRMMKPYNPGIIAAFMFGLSPATNKFPGPATAVTPTVAHISAAQESHTDCGNLALKPFTLPLTLIEFTSTRDINGRVELTWKTAQEVNVTHFEVERSTDGRKWLKLGQVQARGVDGSVQTYKFIDSNPADYVNYYRLKVLDEDRKAEYSPVRLVTMSLDPEVRIYPTYARPHSTIYVEGISPELAQVEVISSEGRPTFVTRLYSNTFELPGLIPGIYHVRITNMATSTPEGRHKIVVY